MTGDRNMFAWLKKLLRIHTHERKLFLIGKYCVVKCTTCGEESIPWIAPEAARMEAERLGHHANDAKEMREIDRRISA